MMLNIGDIITILALIVSTVSAIAAMISARAAANQVKLMKEEVEGRERPYIDGSFRIKGGIAVFPLENRGNAAAINVSASFDGISPDTVMKKSLNEASLFSHVIKFFPAGEQYSHLVAPSHILLADGAPKEFKLKLSYQSVSGRPFSDVIDYNLDYLREVLLPSVTIEELLKKINDTLSEGLSNRV